MEEESEGERENPQMEVPKSPTMLPWDRFSNWLHCACVVTFDLELGQAMELIYPGHTRMTEKEKMNICYLSFPDSNSGCMGDTQFHFRIRQCPGRRHTMQTESFNNIDYSQQLQNDNSHYYGFVYFRQTKDKTIRRGYFQKVRIGLPQDYQHSLKLHLTFRSKSLVLISKLPFVALFSQLVSKIAPEYFENGEPSLESACHDIDQWDPPQPGETVNLPIFGTVIQVRIPPRSDKLVGQVQVKSQIPPTLPAPSVLPSLFEVDIFSSFQSILPHVQMLWELVLAGEPLVVMAAAPSVTSATVQSLVSIISPINYCSDYRPYFTIHDSEFKEYTTKTQAPPPVILGVTNPFFAKTLQHWPHILRIGEMSGEAIPKGFNKLKKSSAIKTLDSKPGVYTRYKSFLMKDKGILKRLMKGIQSKRPVEAQNAILRRHFLELTQSFMIPLERYMASLMPLQRNISPHKGPPSLRPFDVEEFVRSLDQSGPQLTSGIKGDWEGLYRKFFRSSNFEGWHYHRQAEVNQKLQVLHMEALCQADLMVWIQDKEEVEVVDLILRIREKLKFARKNNIVVTEENIERLHKHMQTIISSLPEDLQSVLKT